MSLPGEQPIVHDVSQVSDLTLGRRQFLRIAGITAGAIMFASCADSRDTESVPSSVALANEQSPPTTLTSSKASSAETNTSGEVKSDYSLADLVEYARTKTFAEPNPKVLHQTHDSITNAPSLEAAKFTAEEAMLKITGHELLFNINPNTITPDPNTSSTLPDTREDPNPTDYAYVLGNMYQMLGVQEKGFVSLPTAHNIIEDYIVRKNEEGELVVSTGIGGTVDNTDGHNIISMDQPEANYWPMYAHESSHISAGLNKDYETDGKYFHLREQGIEQFGSVLKMFEHLVNIKPNMTETDYQLAKLLIDKGDNVSIVEDAACAISRIVETGYLPESNDPLLKYLRSKQLQAIADVSEITGTDFGAAIAWQKRFGSLTHPATLASVAEAGILDHISPFENGILGAKEVKYGNSALSPGTTFINIGTPEDPEVIMMEAIDLMSDPIDPDGYIEGYYQVSLVFPEASDAAIDLSETPPSTTTTTLPIATEPPADSNYSNAFVEQNPLAVSLISRIAPNLLLTGDGYTFNESYDAPAPGDPSSGRIRRVNLTFRAESLRRDIDRGRIVGMIKDTYLFKAA